jgi:hypothetical protein
LPGATGLLFFIINIAKMFQLLIAARRSLKIIPSARYEFSSVEVIPKIIKPVTNRALFEDAWVSKLSRRSVISVRGQDSTAILQNVGTTDMRKFEDVDRAALYTWSTGLTWRRETLRV